MRFLPFCLLATTTALAQQADSVKGRQRLDKQRCFGGICLGQEINPRKYDRLNTHHTPDNRFSPRAEKARLFGYRVRPFRVYTLNDSGPGIAGIEFRVEDSVRSVHLLQALQAHYGPYKFKQQAAKVYSWRSQHIALGYSMNPNNERMGWATLRVFLRR